MSVYLSPGLVVSPVVGESKLNPYIGWHNMARFGNVTADFAAAGTPASNLANPSTANRWTSTSTAEQVITVADIDADVDYVAIASHNFGSGQITVSIEGQADAGFETVFAGVVPADDAALLIRIPLATYQAIRIRLVPSAVAPSAAVLFVGKLIVVPGGISPGYTPIGDGQEVELVGGWSEQREFLGNIVTGAGLSTSTPLRLLPGDWYEAVMRPFIRAANNGEPFFFAWSPVLRPAEVGYCWFSNTARPVISQSDGSRDITLPMQAVSL